MKENETMFEKMKEIIAEQLSVDADSITPESSFKEDLGADSLDLFELVMALEDEYSVEIPVSYTHLIHGIYIPGSAGNSCGGPWRENDRGNGPSCGGL